MSFVNISREIKSKKYKSAEVRCYKCTEPDLKLRFHRRNEQGNIEYWDLTTDSLHLCKTKYLKDIKPCPRCKVQNLRSKKIGKSNSLFELNGKPHECDFSYLYKPLDKREIEQVELGRKQYQRMFYNDEFYKSRYPL